MRIVLHIFYFNILLHFFLAQVTRESGFYSVQLAAKWICIDIQCVSGRTYSSRARSCYFLAVQYLNSSVLMIRGRDCRHLQWEIFYQPLWWCCCCTALLHPPALYLVIGYGVIRMKRGAKVEKKESPTLLLAHRIRLDWALNCFLARLTVT